MFRTAGLWAVLVLMFMVSYTLFRGQGGQPLEGRTVTQLTTFLPLVFVGLFTAFFAFYLRRARGAQQVMMQGVALLQQGRFLDALERFDTAGKRLPKANVIPYNRGLTLVCLWRLEEAEQAFADCVRRRWYGNADLSALLYPLWAVAEAVRGRTGAAREHLALAEKAGAGETSQATLVRLTLAARAGDWAQVRILGQRFELTQLGGWHRGLDDALGAWAAEQLDGVTPAVNPVPLLGETGLDSVRRAWPELADFLGRAAGAPARARA